MSVVDILMNRDGLSQKEAESRVEDARKMMEECKYDPGECETIMIEQLGLEMDYIFWVL